MVTRLKIKKTLKESGLVKIYLLLFLINSLILFYIFIFAKDKEFFAPLPTMAITGLFVVGFEIFNLIMIFISIKRKYPIQILFLPISEILITIIFPVVFSYLILTFLAELVNNIYYVIISLFKILQISWVIYLFSIYFASKPKKEKQKWNPNYYYKKIM